MSNWIKVRIEDIGEVVGGSTPSTKNDKYYGGDIAWITPKDLSNFDGRFISSGERNITEAGLESCSARLLPKHTVLFTSRAPIGYIAIASNDLATNQGFKSIIPNEKIDYLFLYYLLKYNKDKIESVGSGTTFKEVSGASMKKIEVRIPQDKREQKRIAAILSSLDDKIEINTRMNKVLEETARALFHRWFVEFEFPNDEGKPYKSSGGRMIASEMGEIPEGWSVVELREIVDVHSGYSYKGSELHESQTALATIKNFDRNGGFKLNGFKEIVPSKKVKSEQYVRLHDIIVAHTDLTQNADVIGNCELLVSTAKYDNIIISMDLVKVVPKKTEINNYFVMSILSNVKFKQHSLGYINGTTVLHLSKSAIPDYKIPLPENMLICMVFGTILENIYTLITKNINENQVILEIRDSLIPKLMNGKVKVI